MMENKLVQRFVTKVNELITSINEKNCLFEALKRYQSSSDIKRLVNELKRVLNEPIKLEIYDYVRPLIRPQDQQSYDKMAPAAAGTKLRVIKLQRRGNESFGFAVRGGYEHNIGIFVSNVQKRSQAEQRGLRMGDEIVRVNGFTIAEAIHEEVLNLIKGRDEIELKVTYIGMVPIKQNETDPVTWQYVDKLTGNKNEIIVSPEEVDKEEVKIFINLRGAPSLGCSIISGPKHFPGIFIESVRPGSLGEDYGLAAGDQIVEVNGKSFQNIQHKEAIVELKGSKELNMVLYKRAGLPLLGIQSRTSPVSERKQRSPRQEDEDSGEAICEILEENVKEQEDRLQWEEEQAALQLQIQRDEEQAREERQQREMELELERQRGAEKLKLEEERLEREQAEAEWREEERRRQEGEAREIERQRMVEEQDRKRKQQEQEQKKQNEQKKQQEKEERKKQKAQEEERKRQEKLKQSAVMAGRATPSSSMKPTLLGAAQPSSQMSFGSSSTGGTTVEVAVRKEEDVALDMEIEGGLGSPLQGRILVSEVYRGGAADKSGEIDKGDQLLSVNGISVVNVTLIAAQELLWEVEQTCAVGDFIRMQVLKGEMPSDEEVNKLITKTRESGGKCVRAVPTSELDFLDDYGDVVLTHSYLPGPYIQSPVTIIQ